MMGEYSAEDFAQARFAERERGTATATRNGYREVWVSSNGFPDKSDDEMAFEGGWKPVVESRVTEHTLRDPQEKAARKREKLVDHIADQDRVIRRRNDEIAVLRLELADAQAPLSLESLAAAYEAAEQADECREGDVLIIRDDEDNYLVRRMDDRSRLDSTARVLSRAPREPWQDLADDLADRSALQGEGVIAAAAKALHLAGWRKGGEEP